MDQKNFTDENQLYFNKTYEPHLTYLETWQTSFWNFTQIVSLWAYERTGEKNICSLSTIFSLAILLL